MKRVGPFLVILFAVMALIVVVCPVSVMGRSTSSGGTSNINPKGKEKPKPVRYDDSKLPPLLDILTELNMDKRVKEFVRMGVTETRLLMRLSSMDFRIMQMEWDGFSDDDVKRLKDKVSVLDEVARMPEEVPPDPNLAERNRLKYGRMYIVDGVQSFDYAIASFGASYPPVGPKKLHVLSFPNEYGCIDPAGNISEVHQRNEIEYTQSFEDTYVVARRGQCSFLQKAQYVKSNYRSASGLVVVNNVDQVESPSSGYGVDRSVSEKSVSQFNNQPNKDFVILSVSNSSWAKIGQTKVANQIYGKETMISAVPLKCGRSSAKTNANGKKSPGSSNKDSSRMSVGGGSGNCYPLLEVEKPLAVEVTCGTVQFSVDGTDTSRSPLFDFLASYVGATLPDNLSHEVVFASPPHGCGGLTSDQLHVERERCENKVVVMQRGQCSFADKLLYAQSVGALYVIVIDSAYDNALQHIGVSDSAGTAIGVPGIMVTKSTGDWLHQTFEKHSSTPIKGTLALHRVAAGSETVAQHWLELAHTPWAQERDAYLMQLAVLSNKYQSLSSASGGKFRNIVDWIEARKSAALEEL